MKSRYAVVVALAAVLFAPASARAVTITFDDLPEGTTLTNQYASAGGPGQGVVFGPLPGGAGDGMRPRIIKPGAGLPNSGTQVASLAHCPGCEFFIPNTTGTFQTPRNTVSVRTGLTGQSDPAVVTLTAYDAAGMVVGTPASATVGFGLGQGVKTKLEVTTPTASIVGFRVSGRDAQDTNKPIAIDDLIFETSTGTPPPQPDFSLTPERGLVNLVEGSTASVGIAIGRLNGSNGPIDLAVTEAPEGVSGTLDPDPAPGTETSLTLAAAPGAPPSRDASTRVTVTGTPTSAGAGSAPRSTTITLQIRRAFELLAAPTAQLDPCGVDVPIRVVRAEGFTAPVELTLGGGAPGLSATLANDVLSVRGDPTGRPLGPATYTVTGRSAGLPDRSVSVTVSGTCPAGYDARITSMQITQGVQSPVLPVRSALNLAGRFNYSDLAPAKLVRERPTVVRVYANLRTGPAEGVPHVPVVLHATAINGLGNEVTMPGSPLLALNGLRRLTLGGDRPTDAEQGSETAAYTFVLPPAWTRFGNPIDIRAALLPALNVPGKNRRRLAACEEPLCRLNDGMTLRRIPFVPLPEVTIRPVRMSADDQEGTFPPSETVFSAARQTLPFPLRIEPYYGRIDITGDYDVNDNNSSALAGDLRDYMCDHKLPETGWMVGVNHDYGAGVQADGQTCYAPPRYPRTAVVEYGRPLSSTGHELGHLFDLNHASGGCDADLKDDPYDDWEPDQMGLTQSVGLDLRQGSGTSGGPFAVTSPPGTTSVFDMMSYCGTNSPHLGYLLTEPRNWISVRNWNKMFEKAGELDRRSAAQPRQAVDPEPSLVVAGTGAGATATISTVTRAVAAPGPESASAYRLLGFDAAGAKVADVAMQESHLHVDGDVAPSALTGVIPAAGVVRVAIGREGQVLAERSGSAAAPTVSVTGAPRFRRGRATIRWTAADADGDDLRVAVAYAAGDTGFQRIWMGDGESVTVPSRWLRRSRAGRVRVTVNDGFHTASATSKPFASPGGAPAVRILSPLPGARQSTAAGLVMRGEAYDDAGRPVTGKALTWRAGKRVLGHGEAITAHGVRTGAVTLVARDAAGREGRASVRVRMRAAAPFLTLAKVIGRAGRTVRLRVAASEPGRLRVLGRTYAVGRRPRVVRVRVPKGRGKLVVRLGSDSRTLALRRG